MSQALAELDITLDSESWDYLNREYIPIARSVEKAVAEGIQPDVIKRRVLQRLGQHREPLAIRCEAASRYLYALKAKAE